MEFCRIGEKIGLQTELERYTLIASPCVHLKWLSSVQHKYKLLNVEFEMSSSLSWSYFNWEATAKHVSFCYWFLERTVRPSPVSFLFLSPSCSIAQLSSKQQHTLVSVCECSQQPLEDTLNLCVCVCVWERFSIETFPYSISTQMIQIQNGKCAHHQSVDFLSLESEMWRHNIWFVTSWINAQ